MGWGIFVCQDDWNIIYWPLDGGSQGCQHPVLCGQCHTIINCHESCMIPGFPSSCPKSSMKKLFFLNKLDVSSDNYKYSILHGSNILKFPGMHQLEKQGLFCSELLYQSCSPFQKIMSQKQCCRWN